MPVATHISENMEKYVSELNFQFSFKYVFEFVLDAINVFLNLIGQTFPFNENSKYE